MKFIDDYLSELFGCRVCDVKLTLKAPARIVTSRIVSEDEEKAILAGKETMEIQVNFKAFDNELPSVKGSLRKRCQDVIAVNLSEYTYMALRGEETSNLFKYALGFNQE